MGVRRSPSYLVRQDSGYCFRLHVPPDLSTHINIKELRYSLGGVSLKKARMRASKLGCFVWGLLDHARRDIRARGYTTMNGARIKSLILEYFQQELVKNNATRLENDEPYSPQDLEGESYCYADQFEEVSEDLARVNLCRVSRQVDEYLKEKAVTDILPNSLEFKSLALEMLKAQHSLLRIFGARAASDYKREGELKKEYLETILGGGVITPKPDQELKKTEEKGPRISETIETYLQEKVRGKFSIRSQNSLRGTLKTLAELTNDPYVRDIDYGLVRSFFDILQRLPSHRAKKEPYRGKSVDELLAMNIPEEGRIAVDTINAHIRWVKQWGAWATRWGHMDKDYTDALRQITKPDTRVDEERDAFTKEELEILFKSPDYRHDKFKLPYKFWLPVLALYTGARLAELSQLELDDVQQVDGTWCFVIQSTEKGNDAKKRLKTKASRRCIPLHDFLVQDLHLIKYVDALRKAGASRLFPELTYYNHSYGQAASRWFQTYREDLGLEKKDRKITFHSFRHTLTNHLKQQEANGQAMAELDGHSTGSITAERYGKRYPPAQLKRMTIDKISYGLDLSHLKRSKYVTDPHGVAKQIVEAQMMKKKDKGK